MVGYSVVDGGGVGVGVESLGAARGYTRFQRGALLMLEYGGGVGVYSVVVEGVAQHYPWGDDVSNIYIFVSSLLVDERWRTEKVASLRHLWK